MQNEPAEASIDRQFEECTAEASIDRPSEELNSSYGGEADGELAKEFSISPADAEAAPMGESSDAPTSNTTAHLSSSVPRAAKLPQGILTKGEMAEIRSIFGDIDDAEIQRLYKRVTK